MDMAQRRITLTQGNISNSHFYLRNCEAVLPQGAIGGRNKKDLGQLFTVAFRPGQTAETDIDGAKMILRNRSAIRDFFERTGASAGDEVIITRQADRALTVELAQIA
jgi:hypothetical protein